MNLAEYEKVFEEVIAALKLTHINSLNPKQLVKQLYEFLYEEMDSGKYRIQEYLDGIYLRPKGMSLSDFYNQYESEFRNKILDNLLFKLNQEHQIEVAPQQKLNIQAAKAQIEKEHVDIGRKISDQEYKELMAKLQKLESRIKKTTAGKYLDYKHHVLAKAAHEIFMEIKKAYKEHRKLSPAEKRELKSRVLSLVDHDAEFIINHRMQPGKFQLLAKPFNAWRHKIMEALTISKSADKTFQQPSRSASHQHLQSFRKTCNEVLNPPRLARALRT